MSEQRHLWTNILYVFQAVGTILVLALAAVALYTSARNIAELNQRQIEIVQAQNDLQLCAQHEIILAVRKIGVKLGLPVEDIAVPPVKGLDCAS